MPSDLESESESEPESESASDSIRSPESESVSELEQHHHDTAPLFMIIPRSKESREMRLMGTYNTQVNNRLYNMHYHNRDCSGIL